MRIPPLLALWWCLGAAPSEAADLGLGLGVEAGGALPAGPQQTFFEAGLGMAARGTLALAPTFDAEFRASYLVLAPQSGSPLKGAGAAITAGPGLRFGLPRTGELIYPWLDFGAFYTRTGAQNRMGFDAGLGLHLRRRADEPLWFGLTLRYVHIFGLESEPGFRSQDASLFVGGLSIELDRPAAPVDLDFDGVADRLDACPSLAGAPGRTDGCPEADPENGSSMELVIVEEEGRPP